jgi:hypothetical protein
MEIDHSCPIDTVSDNSRIITYQATIHQQLRFNV